MLVASVGHDLAGADALARPETSDSWKKLYKVRVKDPLSAAAFRCGFTGMIVGFLCLSLAAPAWLCVPGAAPAPRAPAAAAIARMLTREDEKSPVGKLHLPPQRRSQPRAPTADSNYRWVVPAGALHRPNIQRKAQARRAAPLCSRGLGRCRGGPRRAVDAGAARLVKKTHDLHISWYSAPFCRFLTTHRRVFCRIKASRFDKVSRAWLRLYTSVRRKNRAAARAVVGAGECITVRAANMDCRAA